MPNSFEKGLAILQEHQYRDRLPFLWQIFIEVFGGYYALKDGSDLAALATITGIPQAEIESCLALFDSFFPIKNGWFIDLKEEIRMMKMVPAAYRGTGVFFRDFLFGRDEHKKSIPKMNWLVRKWYSAIYEILEPDLGR